MALFQFARKRCDIAIIETGLGGRLDATNVVQWGFAVGEWPRVNFLGTLVQNGGRLVSEDGKTVTVNSPEGVTALELRSTVLAYWNGRTTSLKYSAVSSIRRCASHTASSNRRRTLQVTSRGRTAWCDGTGRCSTRR